MFKLTSSNIITIAVLAISLTAFFVRTDAFVQAQDKQIEHIETAIDKKVSKELFLVYETNVERILARLERDIRDIKTILNKDLKQ